MKEIRLTLATDDFGAISQFLIERGVEFRVEPWLREALTRTPATAESPAFVEGPSSSDPIGGLSPPRNDHDAP